MKNRKPEYTEKEDITLICSATINGKEYLPSKLRKDPDYFYGNLYYRISELISNKELIDRDFSFSTKMSFYDDEYSATIKAGTLLTGFSYKIEFFSIINDEITDFNESFVFKVV